MARSTALRLVDLQDSSKNERVAEPETHPKQAYVVLAERPEELEKYPSDIRWLVRSAGLDG